ncbi:thioesterase II family protein [Streptomyces sp. AP-93]|uniref:thioesterase II family protein n=1 Tax=Streptomyces sp. AP-93 TaxID=2929048 RepID=UPI001FB01DC9|nr:alpha/beta fold hydrolase [Streptomyces sp. AP-93]MCJ0874942.1 alpha/beta fold hydrolase [Streptomyces sp. AP-93]
MTVTQDWLRCVTPRPEAAVRLICLPHAGGSASFYAGWGALLPQAEVHAVAYPGRAHRFDDPLAEDLVEMAREIADAIAPLADKPLALFGHSLGAAVALETARALEAAGIPVVHLFASGSRNGPLPGPLPPPSEDPAELVEQLIRLGGTDPELAKDPDFQDLVLPYTLGDGKLFHAYRMSEEPQLCCPVTCVVGDADDDADIRPWAKIAPEGFVEHIVAGDHFYLSESPPDEIIAATLGGHGEGQDA